VGLSVVKDCMNLSSEPLPDTYVVEHISPNAISNWLSDFDAEEIELVSS
jgi:hypothetical protein